LGLLPGPLTPTLHEGAVRLGTSLPFAEAAGHLARFTGVTVSEATVRRLTEAAGAAYVEVQEAEAARLLVDAPPAPPGPAKLQLSADGAMVPLVGGEWGEVKLLAIGEIVPDPAEPEGVRTTDLSYFARRLGVEAFVAQAAVETHRRGVETAGLVELLGDGSPWCQQVGDAHRPDAIRALDHPHAVEHLTAAAEASHGAKTPAARAWVAAQAHALKHDDPADVLAALRALPVGAATDPAAATEARDATLGYLEARWAQIQYATFRAMGLPIGSGAVESGNKRVVLARLKGAGMRWAPAHVNPLAALRCALCNDRWAEAWGQIAAARRAQVRARTAGRRAARRAAARAPAPDAAAGPLPLPPAWLDEPDGRAVAPPPAPGRPKLVVAGRPSAAHPWKRTYRLHRASLATPTKP
jgi:hypothetical protein